MDRLLFALTFLAAIGSGLIGGLFNVPLNNQLAAVKADSAAGTSVWQRYLSDWTAWNHVRTAASLAAAASFIMALVGQAA